MEFDILDTQTGQFLSTKRRHQMLHDCGITHVSVVAEGAFEAVDQLLALIRPSLYKSPDWRRVFEAQCRENNVDIERAWKETDDSDLAEGMYVKWEDDEHVLGRYKMVRPDFTSRLVDSGKHWMDRKPIPNLLAPGVDLYA